MIRIFIGTTGTGTDTVGNIGRLPVQVLTVLVHYNDYNDYKDYHEGESTQIPVIRIFIGTAGTGTGTVLVVLVDCL